VGLLEACGNHMFPLRKMLKICWHDLQAKGHGQAGYDHAKAGAEEKKEGHKAATEARKDAAQAEYKQQK
jgi:hypothetical protein